MLNIKNTLNPETKPSIVMMVYGEGGVGKSTFASTSDKPLMLDFENGSKYFGLRGINMDIVNINSWADVVEFKKALISGELKNYNTIVIDPIGEAMEKLKRAIIGTGQSKWVQKSDNSLTMAGWGELKFRMKDFLKTLRDSGKNVILIGHVEEKDDEGVLVKRPMIETKIATDIRNLVDIVGYMFTVTKEDGEQRVICVHDNAKFWAKDRTGTLDKYIKPDFKLIAEKLQTYAWAKEPVDTPKVETPKPVEEEKVATTNTATSLNERAKEQNGDK